MAPSRWITVVGGTVDKRELTAVRKRVDEALQADADDACVTVIRGLTLAEVFPVYGIASGTRPRPYLELEEESQPRVAFFERPDAVIAVEDAGLQGNRKGGPRTPVGKRHRWDCVLERPRHDPTCARQGRLGDLQRDGRLHQRDRGSGT